MAVGIKRRRNKADFAPTWCRWWDSNPHGFPNDFESFASAIPPHRLIFNFETFVPVSEDWRDVQEGCKKSCFDKLSKFNEHS